MKSLLTRLVNNKTNPNKDKVLIIEEDGSYYLTYGDLNVVLKKEDPNDKYSYWEVINVDGSSRKYVNNRRAAQAAVNALFTEIPVIKERFSVLADSREDDYKKTAEALPENFYVQLLVKLQRVLSKKKSVKDFTGTIESKVLGNIIRFTKRGSNLSIAFNGTELPGVDNTHISAVDIAQLVANSEIKGDIEIRRPEGRSLNKDIVELEPIKLRHKGLKFPLQLQKMLRTDADTGKEVVATKKGQLNKRAFLREIDYNYGITNGIINADDYLNKDGVYIKKSSFVPLGNLETSIYNTDEIIARSDEGEFYSEQLESGKPFVVEFNGDIYLIRKNKVAEKLK